GAVGAVLHLAAGRSLHALLICRSPFTHRAGRECTCEGTPSATVPDVAEHADVAPYVPHLPATPAPRYADAFPGVQAPRTPPFNRADMRAERQWLQNRPLLGNQQISTIDQVYRRRLQSMLGVEDMVQNVVDALQKTGQLDNTYIVFTSDNGFHLGQHRLPPGKQAAFEENIHVPLIVRGPAVP